MVVNDKLDMNDSKSFLVKDKSLQIKIQKKKEELLKIEKEQNEISKDLSKSLEKIADIKSKIADKTDSLLEEAFIDLAAKNKVYKDLLKQIEKVKLSNGPDLKEMQSKLLEAEREINKAKEKNDELNNAARKFRMDANIALEKALKYSDKIGENL